MTFGFSEEQELLRRTARDFLAEHADTKQVREAMEGCEGHSAGLWSRLADLGWLGLVHPEEHGGAGLGLAELAIVLEELGRVLAPVPFLPTAIGSWTIQELGSAAQRDTWLPRIASGEVIATLAITEDDGREDLDDLALEARPDSRDPASWILRGRKLFVPDARIAHLLVTVARTPDGPGLFLVPTAAAGVRVANMRSMDPLRPLHEIEYAEVELPATALLGGGASSVAIVEGVLDRARVMICAEMVGGAERCLEASVAYAKEREQFGRPIGVNQAIKHKCADMLFEVESARSLTYYAAWAAREQCDEASLAAAMAKAYVSDAYRRASAENIQIHGGVGFTWEYDCHLYFKRAKSDEAWLGDARQQRVRIARMLQI